MGHPVDDYHTFIQMKYAVDRSLAGKKYDTADVEESLARVMK